MISSLHLNQYSPSNGALYSMGIYLILDPKKALGFRMLIPHKKRFEEIKKIGHPFLDSLFSFIFYQ
jgi:hypothetical protein